MGKVRSTIIPRILFIIHVNTVLEPTGIPVTGNPIINSFFDICSSIYIYCDMPGSPCLSKKGESNVWFVPF